MSVHNGRATSVGMADPHLWGNKSVSKQGTPGTMGIVSVIAHFWFLFSILLTFLAWAFLAVGLILCIVGAIFCLSGFYWLRISTTYQLSHSCGNQKCLLLAKSSLEGITALIVSHGPTWTTRETVPLSDGLGLLVAMGSDKEQKTLDGHNKNDAQHCLTNTGSKAFCIFILAQHSWKRS